jgi:myo-inositol 2-dehydrogenase / D-chiro-inositol 1-dehydrogenase
MQAYYLTGPIWLRERQPGMSDMEWQCRNWYYFNWLSGDHIVEQFVHNLDVIHWVMGGPPDSALGIGGRQVRVSPSYGHIYDHFSIEYAYPNDVRIEAKCRQMEGTTRRVTNKVVGTEGIAELHTDRSLIRSHAGQELFRHPERGNNPFVQEHVDLIASIRNGAGVNDTRDMAESTLIGVLGRESAYTGQELTWNDILNANLDIVPKALSFGPAPFPPIASPGVTTLDRAPGA